MAKPPPSPDPDAGEPVAEDAASRDLEAERERDLGHDRTAPDALEVPAYHPTAAQRDEDDRKGWSSWAQWSAIGFEFAAAVGLFFLLGHFLDATWGTQPWLGVAGAGLGILLGMYVLILKALRDESASTSRVPEHGSDGPRHPGN
jgi:F0F1-type ATP synthase assembly protein I